MIELNARNLLCPMPVIRLQNLILTLPALTLVQVHCTDPGTRQDIPTWCRINGHEVIKIDESERGLIFEVRVSSQHVPKKVSSPAKR
ncbi:MAG: sulfurtransferase TusA family protein [Gammaproteobacteria bacterium]|nr:sulfurtransferase TusA family protein [Gammaproteobacteria bacterium]